MAEKVIESPDLSLIRKEHADKWVVLSKDYKQLIGVGSSLSTVLEQTKDAKEKVVIKVLPNLGYAPTAAC